MEVGKSIFQFQKNEHLTSLFINKMKKTLEQKLTLADEPDSPTINYLLEKPYSESRKTSNQSDIDRPNFCCNINTEDYTVMRVYMNSSTNQQVKLYYTKFIPKNKKRQICIVHGFGETSDDYLQVAQYYAKNGYFVNLIDLRGFGYSGGARTNEPIKEVFADIGNLLKFCCVRELETFILAHGLGAMFVSALLQENPNLPISGVIFISPMINYPESNNNSWLHKFAIKFVPFIVNHLEIGSKINPTALVRNPEMLKKKIESFFSYQFLTIKMVQEYDRVSKKVQQDAYKFCYPLLICRGGKDFIQEQMPVRQFFNNCSNPEKELKIFETGYNELHKDYEGEQVREYVKNWMEERKQKVKWKSNMKPLNLDHIMKRQYFRKFVFGLISFILAILAFMKKFRKSISSI